MAFNSFTKSNHLGLLLEEATVAATQVFVEELEPAILYIDK